MKLDEYLPALPEHLALVRCSCRQPGLGGDCDGSCSPFSGWIEDPNKLHNYGLACARAGALAALDEAFNLCANDPDHRLEVIRRLRDTIMEGK